MATGLNLMDALKSPRISEILRSRTIRQDTKVPSRKFFNPELVLVFKAPGGTGMGEYQVNSCNPGSEQVLMAEVAGWNGGDFIPSRHATLYVLRTWKIQKVNLVRRRGKSFVELTLKR